MKLYDERLHKMLGYKRPHGSQGEIDFINEFLIIDKYEVMYLGDKGDPAAYLIEVGESDTIFSCHLDTVHSKSGKQRIKYNKTKEIYYKSDKEPLGADDTAGCWLMLEMIDAGVAGTYLFHRGEERGGIGSTYIANHYKDFLRKYKRAIAFDRKGSTDVITHQGWTRCASNAFANALADMFNEDGESMYMACDTGVFTDTANYTDYIPECTNISCGYANEHTANETLHLPTLFALRDNCLRIKWEELPTERDPSTIEYLDDDFGWGGKYRRSANYSSYEYGYDDASVLYTMTRSEMEDYAYTDPIAFVNLVRQELLGEYYDDEEKNYKGLRYGC